MPWKNVSPMEQKQGFVSLAASGHFTITELCRDFAVSRKTVHKWVARHVEGGMEALADRRRRGAVFKVERGAVCHVMARGDGGKQLFCTREDHESFLHWLEKVCGSHRWRVQARVQMGNQDHLLGSGTRPCSETKG